MNKNKVVIIGGGASGLMAAITASRNDAQVTIIEHKDKIGKKILMTGNGKCNLTNVSDFHDKYFSDNIEKAYNILEKFTPADTCLFFKELGLYTKEKKDGGIYPVSEQAASVLDVLRLYCNYYKIRIITSANIGNIDFDKKIIDIKHEEGNEKLEYDKLIIATGGKAASVSGSDGSGYEYAKMLGLKIIKPLPSLVQLKCDGSFFKNINGVRTESRLKLYIDDKDICEEKGELQLTDYGISGIPVFQISRHAAKALDEKKKVKVIIDFLPFINEKEFQLCLKQKNTFSFKSLEEYLNGLLNKKLSIMLCKQAGVDLGLRLGKLSDSDFKKVLKMAKSFEVNVTATNSFDQAQVTCGGISLEEINLDMSCIKNPNVYFTGEILDCDGICGGYNLQWAWATGFLAGKHSAIS